MTDFAAVQPKPGDARQVDADFVETSLRNGESAAT